MNRLHWLDRLLPQLPHYGFEIVFIVVFLSNIGVPFPGKVILFGAGFVWGRAAGSLWEPILAGTLASFLGGICVFWLGRRLGHSRLEKIRWLHLTPTRLEWPERFFKRHGDKTVFLARFIPVIPSAVATLLEGTTALSWPSYLMAQSCRLGRLHHGLHYARVFSRQEVAASASMVRPDRALCDHGRDCAHLSRDSLPQSATPICRTLFIEASQ